MAAADVEEPVDGLETQGGRVRLVAAIAGTVEGGVAFTSLGAFEKFDQLPGFAAPYEMLLDAEGIDGEAYSYADRFPGILNEHKEALMTARRHFDALRTRDLEATYPR